MAPRPVGGGVWTRVGRFSIGWTRTRRGKVVLASRAEAHSGLCQPLAGEPQRGSRGAGQYHLTLPVMSCYSTRFRVFSRSTLGEPQVHAPKIPDGAKEAYQH